MKEPSEVLVLEKFQITIFEERDYNMDSSDNSRDYSNKYINEDQGSSTLPPAASLAENSEAPQSSHSD